MHAGRAFSARPPPGPPHPGPPPPGLCAIPEPPQRPGQGDGFVDVVVFDKHWSGDIRGWHTERKRLADFPVKAGHPNLRTPRTPPMVAPRTAEEQLLFWQRVRHLQGILAKVEAEPGPGLQELLAKAEADSGEGACMHASSSSSSSSSK